MAQWASNMDGTSDCHVRQIWCLIGANAPAPAYVKCVKQQVNYKQFDCMQQLKREAALIHGVNTLRLLRACLLAIKGSGEHSIIEKPATMRHI